MEFDKIMWPNQQEKDLLDSDVNGSDDSVGEELPIWVRGEQRWVSGIDRNTTCQDVIEVLLQNEESRGRHIGPLQQYHIVERWRGVEQPLASFSAILDIWNAWGTAQPEVKMSLRRIKHDRRRDRYHLGTERALWKTVHPKRLQAFKNETQLLSSTEELLKLVLVQGEVIRRQLKKLRHSEHQIGYLEDRTHKARIRKHGSNYLLETYLKSLSDAVDPTSEEVSGVDKNSDSGVITEGDSEQSNKQPALTSEFPLKRFSPSFEECNNDAEDYTNSTAGEYALQEQADLLEVILKVNKRLLREEECVIRLQAKLYKYEKAKINTEDVDKHLTKLQTEMAKSTCEMQHNSIVLEEIVEALGKRRVCLQNLHKDLLAEEQESEMLQALLYMQKQQTSPNLTDINNYCSYHHHPHHAKELFDTLV